MLRPPPELLDDGILVGYSLEHERHTAPIGFIYGDRRPARTGGAPTWLTPILHTGGGHLLTIAPTGAGKGVSCIIPTLLRFPGPVIVIDPKGENWAVTGERRRALGQDVVLLDPMGITGAATTSALNPLDLIDPQGPQSIDDASMLSSLLSGGIEREDPRNLFWYQRGEQLLTGVIQYVATEAPRGQRNLSEVRRILNLASDDFLEFSRSHLARAADPDVRQIAGTLLNPAQEMIGSIIGMSQNSLGFLRGELLHRSTARSTFDLDGVTRGDPLSIFLVIPPDKLQSHRNLLRVWVGTLMAALMRRRAPMRHNTLFILDEAAQLGPLEQLRQAITLLRGYGLQTWSFWQDHSQLSNLYPSDWQTMYNNCRVHQAFGFTTLQAADAIAKLTGFHDPLEALRLDSDEMLLSVSGDETVIAQKPNYLTDPAFQGQYAPNPFYRQSGERPPAPQRAQRRYRRPGRRPRAGGGGPDDGLGSGSGERAEGTDPFRVADPPGERTGEAGSAGDDALGFGGDDALDFGGEEGDGEEAVAAAPFSAGSHESAPIRGLPLLVPGGLTPLPWVSAYMPSLVPPTLDLVEGRLGQRWHRYRTVVRFDNLSWLTRFYLCELGDAARVPSREMILVEGTEVRVFAGGRRQLAELAREGGMAATAPALTAFAWTWLHFTRGRWAPVRVVGSLDELVYWTGRDPEALSAVEPLLRSPRTLDPDGGVCLVEGTALVAGDLHLFTLPVRPDGEVGELGLRLLEPGVGPPLDVMEEVEGDPAVAALHGPWAVVAEPERSDLLSWLTAEEADGARGGAPLLRRSLPCYPDVDLIRLPPSDPHREPGFLLWAGARPWRVTEADFPAINARLLSIETPLEAEAFMRVFAWLPEANRQRVLILDRPSDLAGLLRNGAELPRQILDDWSPMTARAVDEGEAEGPGFALQFMLLAESSLYLQRAFVAPDGTTRGFERREIASGLDLDPERLRRAWATPALGAVPVDPAPGDTAPAAADRVEQVLGDPGLARIHGPWEVLPAAELAGFAFAVGSRLPRGSPAEPSFVRIRPSCWPGTQVIRVPPPEAGWPVRFFHWRGGPPVALTLEALPELNRRYLQLRTPEQAAEYAALYAWLRSRDDYPIVLLRRPEDLASLLAVDPRGTGRVVQQLHDRWVPLAVERGEEGGEAVFQCSFTLLEGTRLAHMRLALGPDGGIRSAREAELASGLPVDPMRLAAARALPALGGRP